MLTVLDFCFQTWYCNYCNGATKLRQWKLNTFQNSIENFSLIQCDKVLFSTECCLEQTKKRGLNSLLLACKLSWFGFSCLSGPGYSRRIIKVLKFLLVKNFKFLLGTATNHLTRQYVIFTLLYRMVVIYQQKMLLLKSFF